MTTSENPTLEAQVQALEDGRGYLERADLRVLDVFGTDAQAWLHDLVTGAVGAVGPGGALDSLLLSPTGHIQATMQIQHQGDRFVLLQAPEEPRSIHDLLRKYVLSSDVTLIERSTPTHAFWIPGSMLELVADDQLAATRAEYLARDWMRVDLAAVEAFRIWTGQPRFPVDLTTASLPGEHEPLLLATIDFSKGCFLGQESVAKVRNLGHPSHQVVSAWSSEPVDAGEAIFDAGREVGLVTSAVTRGEETRLLGRIRWSNEPAQSLHTGEGNPLHTILA